ncbi:Carboxypeptidase regulatory-like domain-containing protein [Granulicella rosea]|uniref:Carboxypeptidase regulatory-like domain-containing protein n=1 Tax=Granulicella rosea TaxID=474952 RepID=A0A239EAB7_9BACT|nr:carboxypeptidase regulatory-like domain-containing protein [Granulicella rosea]SNS41645.1 Carboxypeptidase regulatory-like domain-containing protein [Granulicella rosea]
MNQTPFEARITQSYTFEGSTVFALIRTLLVCMLLLFGVTLSSLGQSGQGAITGRVIDGKGALVQKAVVEITNFDTKVSVTTKTNAQGFYSIGSLNPGPYTVTVTADGFQRSTVESITVGAAASVSIDVTLKIGSNDVSITVTAEEALLSKNTSDVTTTVDHSLVESLPYPERSSLEAALLVPGVVGDPVAAGGIDSENPGITAGAVTPGSNISIAGAPAGSSSIMVDGSDVTQASYSRAGVNLSGNMVQETTVITGGISAKYGRTGGGMIVQASRAGTNEYHGAITWRHSDPFFQAKQVSAAPIPPQLHENFYGFYVGGPVRIPKLYDGRSKTFFYVGVEPARLNNTINVRGTFLTPDDLAGHLNNTLPLLNLTVLKNQGYAAAVAAPRIGSLYYQAPLGGANSPYAAPSPYAYCQNVPSAIPCGAQYGNTGLYLPITPANGAPAVNDVSNALAANPFAQFVMSLMPTPSNPGPYVTFDNPNGTYDTAGQNASYRRGVSDVDNRYSFRIDEQLGSRDQIFVRYTVIPITAPRFFAVSQDNPLTQTPADSSINHDVAIGYTHVFSNAIVNNAHYSYLRAVDNRTLPPGAMTQDFGAKYGLTPAALGYGFPSLGGFNATGVSYALSGGVTPGGSGIGNQVDQNFIFGDDVTWQRGRHLFQFGVDLRWIQSNQYDNSYTTGGAYTFAQANTNNGSSGGAPLATFDLGIVSSYIASPLSIPGYYRWRYDAGYIQDDWRVLPNVTLNLGLRYNLETPRMEKYNNQPVIVLNQNYSASGVSSPAALCFPGTCGVSKYLWAINWKEFEPRIGISVAPTPRTTIRAAYTIMHLPLTGYFNQPLPDLSSGGSVSSSTGGTNPGIVNSVSNPASAPSSFYTSLNAARGGPIETTAGISPIFVNQSDKVPTLQAWNFTVQYQPGAQTLVQITYQGAHGTHLIAPFNATSQNGDINVPSFPTLIAAVKDGANLSQIVTNCATTASPGCGNPFGVTSGTSTTLSNETELQQLNPFQNFYNFPIPDDLERNGTSEYNGLLLSVTHRQGKNLSLLANYAWSKSLDDVANTTGGTFAASGSSPIPQDPQNLKSEWSVSINDQPSRFRVGYTYILPIGTGQRFNTRNKIIDNLIGNLSTAGIYTVQSGYPNFVTLGSTGYFTSLTPAHQGGCAPTAPVIYCASAAFPSGDTLRPNRVPGVPLINKNWKRGGGGVFSPGFVPYLNPAAFATPGSSGNPRLGNLRRTLPDARTPRETFFDARVSKGFVLSGRYRLNITGTFSNAFNHPAYFNANHTLQTATTACTTSLGCTDGSGAPVQAGTVYTNAASTTFGQIGYSTASRIIRVGTEFIF